MYALLLLLALNDKGSGPPDGVIVSLKDAYEQWEREVSFKANFQLRQGFARSVEEGLRHGIDRGLAQSGTRYSTYQDSFTKSGTLYGTALTSGARRPRCQTGNPHVQS